MNTEDIFKELQDLQRPFLPQHLNFAFNVLNSTINNGFVIYNIEKGVKKSRSYFDIYYKYPSPYQAKQTSLINSVSDSSFVKRGKYLFAEVIFLLSTLRT